MEFKEVFVGAGGKAAQTPPASLQVCRGGVKELAGGLRRCADPLQDGTDRKPRARSACMKSSSVTEQVVRQPGPQGLQL